MTDDRERETIYAVYLTAYERPQPPEYTTLRAFLSGATETTIDEAADAMTLGAIHGAGGSPVLSPATLERRLAAKERTLLTDDDRDGRNPEPNP